MDDRIVLQPRALEHLYDLIHQEGADEVVLDGFYKILHEIMDQPTRHTEPAKFPYAENRLMANFKCVDSENQTWNFGITLRRKSDEEGLVILTIRGAKYNIDE